MSKNIWIIIFGAISLFLSYLVYDSINGEVNKRISIDKIEKSIIGRLDTLRMMQMAFKESKGQYANSFDELFNFMENGKIAKVKKEGDVDGEVVLNLKIDSLFVNPLIELFGSKINISHLKLVPPQDTAIFKIKANKIEKNGVTVPVFEIEDPHPINQRREKALKVGDINDIVTSGNWK